MNDLFSVTLAAAPLAVPSPSATASRILAVAEALQHDLAQGFQIDALRLRLEMERAFGGSDADGAWDWKLAYEAGEVALVLFLRKFGRALLARTGSPSALLPILAKVAGLLPTHTRRSEEMERFQQFSTPLPMGLAAMAAAQITSSDFVLEPSAGTGLLAILAEIAGSSLALNELAYTRAELLRHLFPGCPVTSFDAAQIDDHLDAGLRPSVILMNPPFSAVANVDSRTTEATARHLRSALARLAPGGRLVAITGAGFAPDAPAWSETFGRLTETAHLVFTGAVFGAAFAKHGTSFETRISVFDKCRGGERGEITADLVRPMSVDASQLLARIVAEVPPRLTLDAVEVAPSRSPSPFPGIPARAAGTVAGKPRATPSANDAAKVSELDAEDLGYTLRETADDLGAARLSDAIYETFRLQAIDIPGAAPHPTKLVQSAAMASVAPPKPDLEEVLWGQVNLFHRATARIERNLDDNEQGQRRLQREQDGSEVKSTELERLVAEGLTLTERRNCMDMMRDHAATEFWHHTGSTWRPRTGSMVNHQHLTAALIDSRDFLAAKRRTEAEVMLPAGPKVALTGGTDFNDHRLIWGKLDQVRTKYPDMVLLHGGSPKGTELIAAKWAEARGVTQVAFKPDWTKHAKAAPFKRNDAMLDVLPVGVLVFPGNGIQENLADKSKKLGIPVVKFERGA